MGKELFGKYGIRQLGYNVESIEETAQLYHDLFGAGPFIDMGVNAPESCKIRGVEQPVKMRTAIGYLGDMEIELNGEDARGRVISRSVAQDESKQIFHPVVVGNSKCFGHVQCDSIIMGKATIESIPAITANSTDAQLIHEAAIGKIAGDQLLKLQTLGLTEEEAEDTILKGFLA